MNLWATSRLFQSTTTKQQQKNQLNLQLSVAAEYSTMFLDVVAKSRRNIRLLEGNYEY